MSDPAAATQAAPPAPSASPAPSPAGNLPPSPAGSAAPPVQNGGNAPAQVQPLAIDPGEDKPQATPATFPERWREIMADGDEEFLKRLQRFTSPVTFGKSWRSSQQKIRAGDHVKDRPDGADETALAAWRAEAGIPEAPDGYLSKVPDGLVFGESDKPMLEGFLKDMHEADAPPAYVHKALQWYKSNEQKMANERAERDLAIKEESQDALRSEWGPEYRANVNAVKSLLTTYGNEELANKFLSARASDGTPLGSDADTLRFLVGLAREINPYGTTVPGSGSQQAKAFSDEKEAIRAAMKDQHSEYYRGPKDGNGETKMQKRYRELVEIELKAQSRAA